MSQSTEVPPNRQNKTNVRGNPSGSMGRMSAHSATITHRIAVVAHGIAFRR